MNVVEGEAEAQTPPQSKLEENEQEKIIQPLC